MWRSKKRLLVVERRRAALAVALDQQPHRLEKRGKVILEHRARPACGESPSAREVGAQLDQRLFHHETGQPVRRVQVDLASCRCRRTGPSTPAAPRPASMARQASTQPVPRAAAGCRTRRPAAARRAPIARSRRALGASRVERREHAVEVRPGRDPRARAGERTSAPTLPCCGASKIADVHRFLGLDQVDDPTIGAHLEPVERARRGEHRVAGEPGEHRRRSSFRCRAACRSACSRRSPPRSARAAARASGVRSSPGTSEIACFGTGLRADAALHALALDEAQLRPLDVVEDRALGAAADAGEAHRAGVAVRRRSRRTAIRPAAECAAAAPARAARDGRCASDSVVRFSLVAANVAGIAHAERRMRRSTARRRAPPGRRRSRSGSAGPGSRAPGRSCRRAASGSRRVARSARRPRAATSDDDVGRAPGERGEPQVEADRVDVVHLDRNHARRQAAAVPRVAREPLAAVAAVEQQARVASAGLRVRREQRAQAQPDVGRRRDRRRSARPTGTRSCTCRSPCTDAARRRSCRRRGGSPRCRRRRCTACSLPSSSGVRADRRLVVEVLRLLELAGHRRERRRPPSTCASEIGARREVALRRRRACGTHGSPRKIEHEIEAVAARGVAARRSRSRRSRRTRRRSRDATCSASRSIW